MSLLQIYGGNIADRFNRRVLVAIGGFTNLTYLVLIPLGGNFWQLLAICALGGLGGAISMPAASALIVEEGRKFGMGSAIAIFDQYPLSFLLRRSYRGYRNYHVYLVY